MAECDANSGEAASLDHGFRPEHRLHATAEFSLVFSARRVLRGKNFDLHYRLRDSQNSKPSAGARLGLVIAKKLARRAVLRNLLKRLGREVFRHARQRSLPYDLILRLARAPDGSLDLETRKLLRADLEQLLIRLAQCKTC